MGDRAFTIRGRFRRKGSQPNGKAIRVDRIVVAMMENRSFDHYFQKARDADLDVDVAPDGFTDPHSEGNPVAPFHDDVHCIVDTAPPRVGRARRTRAAPRIEMA